MKDNNSYNVLIVGNKGREYALAQRLQQDERVNALYFCLGNGGTQDLGENLECEHYEHVVELALKKQIHLAIISEEEPLILGLTEMLEKASILVFGASKEVAKLETSKGYMKAFAKECGIKSASYFETSDLKEALNYLQNASFPLVVKASSQHASVINHQEEALKVLESAFKHSNEPVIIERFLEGFELSVSALVANDDFILLPFCQNYKRLLEGDNGVNTSGMGAFAPANFFFDHLEEKIKDQIFKPTLKKLQANRTPFKGVLLAEIMVVEEEGVLEPYLLDFSTRFEDMECQTILPLVENPLLDLFLATTKGELNSLELVFSKEFVMSVALVSRNYPTSSSPKQTLYIDPVDEKKGHLILGEVNQDNGVFESSGGRVAFAIGKGKSLLEARNHAYEIAQKVHFEGMFYRKDIGFKALDLKEYS
ncbi:phosphoribosylamine--glycine ligase [Helicobacter acinonychis]|uniref:phosphoribosylamine--glycine ligase n=1 Tax=Helicobacter acinonychis (strain Sheeba) TaxID=382638 RepID=Q17VM0_HELAH|nr:phosphoribosylamine--glycine ligase [Helicobacter acinonychis]CAK00306.1 glycinamide ribonucleotide synthetase [Helicobacter acinonychis str. Sheeba]STP05141.1 glycinamide ribonucleotide synthetase [Helicobacter acinonychis]